MNGTIAEQFAQLAARTVHDSIPETARDAARHLILDGVGIALAASTYPFARSTAAGLRAFGAGDTPVIGLADRLTLRDAAVMNGVLIHGIDYDDTHLESVVHVTSSCFPVALAGALHAGRSGADLVTAYVLAVEIAARLGIAARGEMHQIGFHPTGMLATFGTAIAAGWLLRLDAEQLTMVQGIALSMAAGLREYSADASWTKRLHPGWAAACGLTAAGLASQGFTGPRTAYEGKFGLFATHMPGAPPDLTGVTAGLGESWEVSRVAIKPYPACQLSIACIDAAAAISRAHHFTAADIVDIEAVVVPHAVAIVCEPVARRMQPRSAYAAQFSLAFCVAHALLHGRLSLADIEHFDDQEVLAVAQKLRYRVDPDTNYPRHFPGEVIVTLADGRVLRHREAINRGAAERPVTPVEIRAKFQENAVIALPAGRADVIAEMILNLDKLTDVFGLAEAMRGEDKT